MLSAGSLIVTLLALHLCFVTAYVNASAQRRAFPGIELSGGPPVQDDSLLFLRPASMAQLRPDSGPASSQICSQQLPTVASAIRRSSGRSYPVLRMVDPDRGGGLNPFKGPGDFFGGLFKPKTPASQVDTAIDQVLKDAPLPIKMMGGLFKGVASMAGEAMAEAADEIDRVRAATERAVMLDPQAASMLGNGVTTGAPFSQAFSTSNINGAVSKSVNLQMPISGSAGRGTVAVQASIKSADGGKVSIDRCSLSVDGRVVSVSLVGGAGGSAGAGGARDVIDVVAEAE